MGDLAEAIGTAADLASDPYLPEVICRVRQVKQIEHGEPVGTCSSTPRGTPGVLRNMAPALQAYVYAQQHKWVYPLAIAAIVGIPMWVGYELGKGSR